MGRKRERTADTERSDQTMPERVLLVGVQFEGMSEEDIPNAFSTLADLSRSNTIFDRVQQGMLNFLYLGRLMIHPEGFSADPAFQAAGESVIDTSRLFYDGRAMSAGCLWACAACVGT
jgi:hypothetical protein